MTTACSLPAIVNSRRADRGSIALGCLFAQVASSRASRVKVNAIDRSFCLLDCSSTSMHGVKANDALNDPLDAAKYRSPSDQLDPSLT